MREIKKVLLSQLLASLRGRTMLTCFLKAIIAYNANGFYKHSFDSWLMKC